MKVPLLGVFLFCSLWFFRVTRIHICSSVRMETKTPSYSVSNRAAAWKQRRGGPGVSAEGVVRGYGTKRVLHGIKMSVRRGQLYGLLGPSGAGKTTFLKLEQGKVEVFGKEPGSSNHTVPGSAVGYAPQQIALYEDLSIDETLSFFGRMHQMHGDHIVERRTMLYNMLHLTETHRRIDQLTEGEKRCVSVAVALLHNPALVVLDEPTTGLDPVLRHKLWRCLEEMATQGVTVIVTTHYVEEATSAHRVGLIRQGRLMDEGDPRQLIQKYRDTDNCRTLEEVFVHLCKSEEGLLPRAVRDGNRFDVGTRGASLYDRDRSLYLQDDDEIISDDFSDVDAGIFSTISSTDDEPLLAEGYQEDEFRPNAQQSTKLRHPKNVGFVALRKARQLRHSWLQLLFELFIPSLQLGLFLLAIGNVPRGMNVTIVNDDFHGHLGSNFIQYLNATKNLNVYPVPSLDVAKDWVRIGNASAAFFIPNNFSQAYIQRWMNPNDTQWWNASTIRVWQDMSDYQITVDVKHQADIATSRLGNETVGAASAPTLEYEDPLVGAKDTNFSDFLAPGIITTITFVHSIASTAIVFVRERLDGTLDRLFAADLRAAPLIIGHFLTHLVVVMLQNLFMLIIAGSIHDSIAVNFEHRLTEFFLLVLLGLVGMSFGLVIALICNRESTAIQLSLAMFFPALTLSGVLWPIEAVPQGLVWLCEVLPTTWTGRAVRRIMTRAWGLEHAPVYTAILVSVGWIVGLALVSFILLRLQPYALWKSKEARARQRVLQPGSLQEFH